MADTEQPSASTPMMPTTDATFQANDAVYNPTTSTINETSKKNESKFKLPFKVKVPQITALQAPDRTQPPQAVLDPNIYSTKKNSNDYTMFDHHHNGQ